MPTQANRVRGSEPQKCYTNRSHPVRLQSCSPLGGRRWAWMIERVGERRIKELFFCQMAVSVVFYYSTRLVKSRIL